MRSLNEYTREELNRMEINARDSRNHVVYGSVLEAKGLDIDPSAYREGSLERELLEQYHTELMIFAGQNSNVQFPKPALDLPSGEEKIRYKILLEAKLKILLMGLVKVINI